MSISLSSAGNSAFVLGHLKTHFPPAHRECLLELIPLQYAVRQSNGILILVFLAFFNRCLIKFTLLKI